MNESSDYFKKLMNSLDEQIKKTDEPQKFKEHGTYTIEESEKTISKKKILDELKKKYPYSDVPFNKVRDREQIQYRLLVTPKNLLVAEFVLKWEFEHQQRIHKKMAWKLLTELKEKNQVSVEFLDQLLVEFENL